jgi:hypothetical protein
LETMTAEKIKAVSSFKLRPELRTRPEQLETRSLKLETASHCRILGLNAEYSRSVRKFTTTYVSPIARMQPCTR